MEYLADGWLYSETDQNLNSSVNCLQNTSHHVLCTKLITSAYTVVVAKSRLICCDRAYSICAPKDLEQHSHWNSIPIDIRILLHG